jgi:hypothetical protein
VLEIVHRPLKNLSQDEAPSLPFYGPREGPRVHEREKWKRGKEEREKLRGRELWGYVALLLRTRVLQVL